MWGKSDQKQIENLEARVEKLERDMRDVRVDWDMTFEKFAKLNARLAKRMRDAEKASEDASQGTNGGKARVEMNPLADRLLHPYRGAR